MGVFFCAAEVRGRALALNQSAQTSDSKKHKEASIQQEGMVLPSSVADDHELTDNELIRLVSIISVNDTKTIALKYFGATKVLIDDTEYQHRDVTQFKFEILTHWRNTHRPSRQVDI